MIERLHEEEASIDDRIEFQDAIIVVRSLVDIVRWVLNGGRLVRSQGQNKMQRPEKKTKELEQAPSRHVRERRCRFVLPLLQDRSLEGRRLKWLGVVFTSDAIAVGEHARIIVLDRRNQRQWTNQRSQRHISRGEPFAEEILFPTQILFDAIECLDGFLPDVLRLDSLDRESTDDDHRRHHSKQVRFPIVERRSSVVSIDEYRQRRRLLVDNVQVGQPSSVQTQMTVQLQAVLDDAILLVGIVPRKQSSIVAAIVLFDVQ